MCRDFGFYRVAAVVPELHLGQPRRNARELISAIHSAEADETALVVFPELTLTGYTCADLFFQEELLQQCEESLADILRETHDCSTVAVVGLPVPHRGRLFNAAAVLQNGQLRGLVPKIYLPTGLEFYEGRWFATGAGVEGQVRLAGQEAPFGPDLLFTLGEDERFVLGLELCEDLWTVQPPSGRLALAGATVLVNPSASPDVLGKSSYRRQLVTQQSARCLAAYIYASAGPGESSSDLLYGGHALVAENGHLLAESNRFHFNTNWTCADLDLDFLAGERRRHPSFPLQSAPGSFRNILLDPVPPIESELLRTYSRHPFVPQSTEDRNAHCEEILAIQSTALARRWRQLGPQTRLVLGLSGGLDSTLALLVALDAAERLGTTPASILAVTLPGPGTTARTLDQARRLAEISAIDFREISITTAVEGHLRDLNHPTGLEDITFENAQARERTQILMDLANQIGGIVLGTGDLSEAALGWCTFNADHMSMYAVNIGVPKTLVRHLIEWSADQAETRHNPELAAVLHEIGQTPVSPELLPPAADGTISQKTEDILGPYEIHDFYLFHFLRHGFTPQKLLFLAECAYGDTHRVEQLAQWLEVFLRRFFAAQFKRNAMPDGPKVGSVALSQRGDWRMPADLHPTAWLEGLAELKANFQRGS
jgi:NAD+ synthase (glutamine-hydrolysing)